MALEGGERQMGHMYSESKGPMLGSSSSSAGVLRFFGVLVFWLGACGMRVDVTAATGSIGGRLSSAGTVPSFAPPCSGCSGGGDRLELGGWLFCKADTERVTRRLRVLARLGGPLAA
jgi:hypothetical protein